MPNTADIRYLWNNPEYSDLIIRIEREGEWHCNSYIVYPRSHTIRDAPTLMGALTEIEDEEEQGVMKMIMFFDKEDYPGMAIMLHAMYESDESKVFDGQEPAHIAGAMSMAIGDKQFDFAEAAFRALLPSGPDAETVVNGEEMLPVIENIRRWTRDEDILRMADRLEMAWMPMFLLDRWSRDRLGKETIREFLASMKPRAKQEDTSEASIGFVMEVIGYSDEGTPAKPEQEAAPKRKRKATIDGPMPSSMTTLEK
ncbi:unnamed protein product [Zymoseptoria tritici ST99CH_3D7]|uniref:BTB domain-containing protein n=1 Tax=Zymoseptoria tritici (strain ST99CH_3D7) TaxID=1276538 RepID=A0A1X7S5D5_ZYMT9|nr:unnamed protein product [Zymoseptoria tritici ST99CH_3D7]